MAEHSSPDCSFLPSELVSSYPLLRPLTTSALKETLLGTELQKKEPGWEQTCIEWNRAAMHVLVVSMLDIQQTKQGLQLQKDKPGTSVA